MIDRIAAALHRPPCDVAEFIAAYLRTTYKIVGRRIILADMYSEAALNSAIEVYIAERVACPKCGSCDTRLHDDVVICPCGRKWRSSTGTSVTRRHVCDEMIGDDQSIPMTT